MTLRSRSARPSSTLESCSCSIEKLAASGGTTAASSSMKSPSWESSSSPIGVSRLTGSCEMGRMAFCKNLGLDSLDGERTVVEFIQLCEHDYGGDTIRKLKEYYHEQA